MHGLNVRNKVSVIYLKYPERMKNDACDMMMVSSGDNDDDASIFTLIKWAHFLYGEHYSMSYHHWKKKRKLVWKKKVQVWYVFFKYRSRHNYDKRCISLSIKLEYASNKFYSTSSLFMSLFPPMERYHLVEAIRYWPVCHGP